MKEEISNREIEQRLKTFSKRAVPLLARQTLNMEDELLKIWRENDFVDTGIFSPTQIEAICNSIATRKLHSQDNSGTLSGQVFDALPQPTIVFAEKHATWNRAFALRVECDRSWQKDFPIASQVSLVRRLHFIIQKAQSLRAKTLLLPLNAEIMRVEIISLPDRNLEIAYLFPLGETLRTLAPTTLMVLLFQLSGLSLKQIAPLMELPLTSVESISKNHRKTFRALRLKLMSTSEAPQCQEPVL